MAPCRRSMGCRGIPADSSASPRTHPERPELNLPAVKARGSGAPPARGHKRHCMGGTCWAHPYPVLGHLPMPILCSIMHPHLMPHHVSPHPVSIPHLSLHPILYSTLSHPMSILCPISCSSWYLIPGVIPCPCHIPLCICVPPHVHRLCHPMLHPIYPISTPCPFHVYPTSTLCPFASQPIPHHVPYPPHMPSCPHVPPYPHRCCPLCWP